MEIKISLPILLGQDGTKPARIHHEFGGDRIPVGGKDLHMVIVGLNVLNGRVLPNLCALGNGRVHHKVVGVLPVEMQFMAVWLLGNNRLKSMPRIVPLPFFMV